MLLNGVQCRSSRILQTGDVFQIRLDAEGKARRVREECDRELQILYEDEDLLAVFKPGGIPVHPGHGHSRDTLWNQIISLQEKREESWTPRIIGRLDRDTSGIILLARTTEAAAAMGRQRERQCLRKLYLAEAEGLFEMKEGWIDRPIEKDPAHLNRMKTGEGGLPARTHYRVLAEYQGNSILELELEQGRTHQIRVHLAAEGHPLLGDRIYNKRAKEEGAELHLHAELLEFDSPFTGKAVTVKAPMPSWIPEEFLQMLEKELEKPAYWKLGRRKRV